MEQYDFECKPIVAWLNVNQACNMRCKWCYAENSHYNPKRQMSVSLAQELIDISLRIGIREFVLIGGEPTLWAGLFDTLKYIKQHHATVSIITNGFRFSEEDFWLEYQKNPATSLGLSVKSATKTMFYKATGIKQYTKSMLGIQRAIKLHQCGVSAVHNSLVGVSGLLDIARQCKQFGAKSFQLVICSPSFGDDGKIATDFLIPLNAVWDDLRVLSCELQQLYGDQVCYDSQLPLCLFPQEFVAEKLLHKKLQTQCHIFSRSGLNFDCEGNVILCNTIPEIIARKNVDFYDSSSLIRYLNSQDKRQEYRQLARYPSKQCDMCRWKGDCRGGCLMNWLVYDPDEICHAIQ